jgi:hypothetical protein
MLSRIRGKFGPIMIGGIVGFIAFVFIFSGVFNPKSTRGLHQGAVAGIVNGDPISLGEYNRALTQRLEYYKKISGGKISEQQLKAFRVRESVFNELANRKLMLQEAFKSGMVASDEEIRERIRQIPAFQKEGKFDQVSYRRVLEANNYTPSSFERLMREDLSTQQLSRYFEKRVRVSDEEVKKEFLILEDKRNIKYVLLTAESARKTIPVDGAEVKKFLADLGKFNLVKSQFEQKKDREYKDKSFDSMKEQITRDLIASEKVEEIRKLNEKLAQQIEPILTSDKSSDTKINAMLKPYGLTVKTTGFIARTNTYLPGVGDARKLIQDAFDAKSPIDPALGGKAKRYDGAGWWMVAIIGGTQKPDLAKLESERGKIMYQLKTRKEQELFEGWMKKMIAKAKIEKNETVISGGQEDLE